MRCWYGLTGSARPGAFLGALWRVRGVGRLAVAVWGGVRIGPASGADALGVRSRGTLGGRGASR